MTDRFARVALPLPLASSYTYRIPETLGDRVVPGARVVVPVRRRELIGIVVESDTAAPEAAARDVLAAPDAETAIPAGLLETARWMAGYYGAPLGLALKCMLPGGMWGESEVVASLVPGARLPGIEIANTRTPSASVRRTRNVPAVSLRMRSPKRRRISS